MTLKNLDEFKSYNEFELSLKDYASENFVNYYVSGSKSNEAAISNKAAEKNGGRFSPNDWMCKSLKQKTPFFFFIFLQLSFNMANYWRLFFFIFCLKIT